MYRGGVFKAALIFVASLFIFSGLIACSDDAGGDDNNYQAPTLNLPATWYGDNLGIAGLTGRLTLIANADNTWQLKGTLDQTTQEQVLMQGTFERTYDSLITATVLKAIDGTTGVLEDKTEPYYEIPVGLTSSSGSAYDTVNFSFEDYSVTLTTTGIGACAEDNSYTPPPTTNNYKGVWWNDTDNEGYVIDDYNMDPIYKGLEKYYRVDYFSGNIQASSNFAKIEYNYKNADGSNKEKVTKNFTLSLAGNVLTTKDNATNESKSYTKIDVNADDIIDEYKFSALWKDNEVKNDWLQRYDDVFYNITLGDVVNDEISSPTEDNFTYEDGYAHNQYQKASIGSKIDVQNGQFTAPEYFIMKIEPFATTYTSENGTVTEAFNYYQNLLLPVDSPVILVDTVYMNNSDPYKGTALFIYETMPYLIDAESEIKFEVNGSNGYDVITETTVNVQVPRTTNPVFKLNNYNHADESKSYTFDLTNNKLKITDESDSYKKEVEGTIVINNLTLEPYKYSYTDTERIVATFEFTPTKYTYVNDYNNENNRTITDAHEFGKSVTVRYYLKKVCEDDEIITILEEEVIRDESNPITDYFYYIGNFEFVAELNDFDYMLTVGGHRDNYNYLRSSNSTSTPSVSKMWTGSFNNDFTVFTGKLSDGDENITLNLTYSMEPPIQQNYGESPIVPWVSTTIDGTEVKMHFNAPSMYMSLEEYLNGFNY